jgi:outer membrane protein TolC
VTALVTWLAFLLPAAYGQVGPTPTDTTRLPVVEILVREALSRNLDLKQQNLALDRAMATVDEARGGFLPRLDAQARYTRAGGGRTIDFPVGDLLNPVYETLNTLTPPGTDDFPTIENREIAFLRDREQDTRLRLEQPLFAPAALYGYRARKDERRAEQASTEVTRRTIARDVQIAYFGFRQTSEQVKILDATYDRARENLRASRRLVDAGKATPDATFRAEAEVLAVEQRRTEAEAGRRRARSALNLILDRPLDSPIPSPRMSTTSLVDRQTRSLPASVRPFVGRTGLDLLQDRAQADRPELRQLSAAFDATEDQRRLAQTAYLPTVSLVLEGGIQGTTYGLDDEQRFGLASLVLQWNLFDGFRDRARVEQADLSARQIDVRRDAVSQQIDLQVQQAFDDVRVALRSLQTAEARLRAAESSFRLTKRRYDVGRASLVTFTDALSTLTEAELNLAVTRYTLLARLAELRYAAGLPMTPPNAPTR